MAVEQTSTVATARICALGYIGLTAPEPKEWDRFATALLGMAHSPSSTDEQRRYRVDERDWRLAVTEGTGGLDYLGWEVASRSDLDELRARLDASGFATEDVDPATRQVVAAFATRDPAGTRTELYFGGLLSETPFVSPVGATFVTGGQGFSHVTLVAPERVALERFYIDLLGMRVSDHVVEDGVDVVFLHCNPRHHSVGLAVGEGFTGIHHFMLQVTDLDAVGRLVDRLREWDGVLSKTLGRHANDHMVSVYVRHPSGFELEYGANGRVIDDDEWVPALYDVNSSWGHQRV